MNRMLNAVLVVGLLGAATGCNGPEVRDLRGDAGVPEETPTPVPARACAFDADCPAPEVCREIRGRGMVCMPQCREDRDCRALGRLVCRDAQCVAADVETCNQADDDRDGMTDDGFDLSSDPQNCGRCDLDCDVALAHARLGGTICVASVCQLRTDGCADGFRDVNGAASDGCEYACFPSNDGFEEPDGDDNDCDGATDEGFLCAIGDERPCGSGTGICEEGVQRCLENGTWSECVDAAGPRAEACNGVDDDCDGTADEGFDLASDIANCGACGVDCRSLMANATVECRAGACALLACANGSRDTDGNPDNGCERCDRNPPLPDEFCDADLEDEDCDGERNEGCACVVGDERPCGIPEDLHEVGICHIGVETCGANGQWGACAGAQDPLAVEACNGRDDDCDGTVPADELDLDRDGFSTCDGDCDDTDSSVRPSASESCDGVDEDCDGATDEDFFVGASCRGVGACAGVAGGAIECADLATIRCSLDVGGSAYGGVPEVANNRDDDCDGTMDEGFACATSDPRPCGPDAAFNGVGICRVGLQRCVNGAWGACDSAQLPLPAEVCNGRDDDCDGVTPATEADGDRDGFSPCAGDCDDTRRSVNPNASESCDGVDEDCDGMTDEDFHVGEPCDGEGACGRGAWECDGTAAFRCSANPDGSMYPNPAPVEVCANDTDDDCDGEADEGCGECEPGEHRDCGLDRAFHGVGVCRVGVQVCDASRAWGACAGAVVPLPETCNLLDDDCNGITDDACTECVAGTARPCGLDPALNGRGVCVTGIQSCGVNGRWGICTGVRGPSSEACNMLDDDCDGFTPAGEVDLDRDGYALCGGDCDDARRDVFPGAAEACNGLDDDCSDGVDEDFSVGAPCDGVGECGAGTRECADLDTTRCSTDPGGTEDDTDVEVANNRDDDCDGATDEGFACATSDPRPCGLDPALHGVGMCHTGSQRCTSGQWTACAGARGPSVEACNGLDDDCDGFTPANETDLDRDGYMSCAGDCDDARRDVNPDVRERCNGRDDDCDGETDEDFSVGVRCSGEGACGVGVFECLDDATTVCSTDTGGTADASAAETCNDRDDDCDGQVDDVAPSVVASDLANCGACGRVCTFPNATAACVDGSCVLSACDSGFRLVGGSCLPCEVFPTVAERCDGGSLDDDCDGERNEGCACVDGAETPCGLDPALHGRGLCHFGVQTCAGGAWGPCVGAVAPSPEACNGLDDDCSGGIPFNERDGDDDRFTPCAGDCNDADAAVHPNASEVCNSVDDDCNDAVDEGYSTGAPCNVGDLFGLVCRGGVIECDPADPSVSRCSTSPGGSMYPPAPPAEVCANDRDDDCDRTVDEGCGQCAPGDPRPCGLDPLDLHGTGICRVGIQRCLPDGTWGACVGSTPPMPEICNGLDDDCDTVVDDGFDFLTDVRNCGACGVDCTTLPETDIVGCAAAACTITTCRAGWYDLDGDPDTGCEYGCFPEGTEVCDGDDDDCDGMVDENPACVPVPPVPGTMDFLLTLPAGFPLDGTATLCATFDDGVWSCGDYPLTVGADGRTLTASGAALAGRHVHNVCTSSCVPITSPFATWVAVRNPDGTLSAAAMPAVDFGSPVAPPPLPVTLVLNALGNGANFYVEFVP